MQILPLKYQERLSAQPEKRVLDPLEHDPLDQEDEPATPAILPRKAAMRKTVCLWKTEAMGV
jgi:hypothetical protein